MSRHRRELDALIGEYACQPSLKNSDKALYTLRKIASLVKPIMRNRSWKVGRLEELHPDQCKYADGTQLHGLNYGHGERIQLRLRDVHNYDRFLDMDEVMVTMLHELCHNVRGPHDEIFYSLLTELKSEYDDLLTRGYSGEGFLSRGYRVGGSGMPLEEMRRRARVVAQHRATSMQVRPQKLGGQPVLRGTDIRRTIADAAERRRITQGCGTGTSSGARIGIENSQRAVVTSSDEDTANDQAIAEALWEVIQEEEARNAGITHERGSGPIWQEYGALDQVRPQLTKRSSESSSSKPSSVFESYGEGVARRNAAFAAKRAPPRLLNDEEAAKRRQLQAGIETSYEPASESEILTVRYPSEDDQWRCNICTLVNPASYLCCDACGVERSVEQSSKLEVSRSEHRAQTVAQPILRPAKLGWNCLYCGTFMEEQWWTCSCCGQMKATS